MDKPELVPFKAEHLLIFATRDSHTETWMPLAIRKERDGPAWTVLAGGKIIGAGGIMLAWPGVGLCWANFTEAMGQHGIWLTRTVRRLLTDVMQDFCLHRLEVVALAESERDQRWLAAFGFTPEGQKARWYTTDRRDVIRYERVRD